MKHSTNLKSTTKKSKLAAAKSRAESVTSPTPLEPVSSNENPVSTAEAEIATSTGAAATGRTFEQEASAFKQWRIATFADLYEVDEWHLNRVIFIMGNLIRKSRILKRKLIEFTFYEPGRITVVWEDRETGKTIHDPAPEDADPLS